MRTQTLRYKNGALRPSGANFVVSWMSREWWRRRGLARKVSKALGGESRPEAAHDHCTLQRCAVHLDLEWRARQIHPWDRDLSPERQARVFANQLLEDTVTAIRRLFDSLPEVDSIHIAVREPLPMRRTLLEGAVSRLAVGECAACQSAAMTLKLLGICYRLNDGCLEPLA